MQAKYIQTNILTKTISLKYNATLTNAIGACLAAIVVVVVVVAVVVVLIFESQIMCTC